MSATLRTLTVVGAVGAGLSGGIYLAFSTFVMDGLRRTPDAAALAAMQGINRAAPASPVFLLAYFGTGLLLVGLGIHAALHLEQAPSRLVLAAAALFIVSLLLTVGYHVPHNDALALLDPSDPASAGAWQTYLRDWTRVNHLRTLACTVSAVLMVLAARAP